MTLWLYGHGTGKMHAEHAQFALWIMGVARVRCNLTCDLHVSHCIWHVTSELISSKLAPLKCLSACMPFGEHRGMTAALYA